MSTLPSLPGSIMSDFGRALQTSLNDTLGPVQRELSASDEARDSIFRDTKSVIRNNAKIFFLVRTGETSQLNQLISENEQVLKRILEGVSSDQSLREGRLSQVIEKFTEARLLEQFFLTGRLASPVSMAPADDEEYLGASIGLAQELARYVIGRAAEGDFSSITVCYTLVTELNAKMLEFDFRNGPLRRKYDGLKYALKTIEDVMYEISLVDDSFAGLGVKASAPGAGSGEGADGGAENDEAPKKRRKGGEAPDNTASAVVDTPSDSSNKFTLLDSAAIDEIRGRLEAYDKLREDVIKQSRDVQKLSKQAIFAVHRGNTQDCRSKLNQAMSAAMKIMVIINEHPTLRQGAYSNSLEEWAEGALTVEWAEHRRILPIAEMKIVSPYEYVGALSDFTGEIGRFAVASASKRDVAAVRSVLQADVAIAGALMLLNTSGRFTRKTDAVLTNLKKVEDIVYDLSMLQRGGRIGRQRDPEPVAKEDSNENET